MNVGGEKKRHRVWEMGKIGQKINVCAWQETKMWDVGHCGKKAEKV